MSPNSSRLVDWISEPRHDRGVRFADDTDGWRFVSYAELAELCLRGAEQIAAAGARPGGRVCVVMNTSETGIAAFCATLLIGATVAPVAPPTHTVSGDYAGYLGRILATARPDVVVAEQRFHVGVKAALAAAELDAPVLAIDGSAPVPGHIPPVRAEYALLQFTSGSTRAPRGVLLTGANVEAQQRLITSWLDVSGELTAASWLPLHHDMGLVGLLLPALVHQFDLRLLQPVQFIARPLRWLECFGRDGVWSTATPNFGLDWILRKVAPDDLQGMDFTTWRHLIIGAERVEFDVLRRFAALLAPHGFDSRTLLPAYGLAEAALAVTGSGTDEIPSAIAVDPTTLQLGAAVRVLGTATLGEADDPAPVAESDATRTWLTSCGSPLHSAQVRILGQDGTPVGDSVLGEVAISGPSVTRAVLDEHRETAPFHDDWYHTGDAGFVCGTDLYLVGRMGDSMKVHGRTLFAEDIESAVTAAAGAPKNRVTVLLGTDRGAPTVALLCERLKLPPEQVLRVVRKLAGDQVVLRVLQVEQGTIARTTSGKPRRRHLWRQLTAGELADSITAELGDRAEGATAVLADRTTAEAGDRAESATVE
ncbi:AMP-binding protein [Nocardia sp. CS682]|uniref:AMP-binding protein n=1 Tax=Nocardia sp. CS682 TaxID=1047172 RepID=UPI0014308C1E|nr:AMP-binding protein [Nocardia sp. CS682]